jgi:hypothetical protein
MISADRTASPHLACVDCARWPLARISGKIEAHSDGGIDANKQEIAVGFS